MANPPIRAIEAAAAPPRQKPSNYPAPFAALMDKRERRPLGDLFGLTNVGVNLTRLRPGGRSALLHKHAKQDELVYVLEGEVTLVTEEGEETLRAGWCAGFRAGGPAHQLVNRTSRDALYLEIGDRVRGDEVTYPQDDIRAVMGPDGKWGFAHKDGRPY